MKVTTRKLAARTKQKIINTAAIHTVLSYLYSSTVKSVKHRRA
jgi:hypothetical protein